MNETMNHEQWEKIEDKLIKLIALRDNPGSPGEAVAATEAIQRLLLQHNLDMTDINLNKHNGPRDIRDIYKKKKKDLGAKNFLIWRQELLLHLAESNFCKVIMFNDSSDANLVGHPHNIEVVWQLHEYIVEQVRRLCNEGWEIAQFTTGGEHSWRESFYIGAVLEIRDRIKEIRRRLREEQSKRFQALAVIEDDLEKAKNLYFPELKARDELLKHLLEMADAMPGVKELLKNAFGRERRTMTVRPDGFIAGKTAAQNININRPVK